MVTDAATLTPDLLPARGRLSFVKERLDNVAAAFGSSATLARYLGVNRSQPTQWRKGAESPSLETGRALLDLDYVIARAAMLWPMEVVHDWLVGSNAFLNGARPVDVVRSEGAKAVIEALDAELSGAYA